MLLPIRTDAPTSRFPITNVTLIGLNLVIHTLLALTRSHKQMADALALWAAEPSVWSYLTYQFIHADLWHLAGNMLILWIFGNATNDKMGNWTYLLFYLAGGVFAGVGYVLVEPQSPVIGASGAVAAITTAFVVLFPRSTITVLFFMFFIFTFEVPSLFLVGFFVVVQNMLLANTGSGVAYSAHLAGYFFGFVSALGMLWLGALPRDQFDMFALLDRARRRQQWRDAMADPQNAAAAQFGRVAAETGKPGVPMARPVVRKPEPPQHPEQEKIDSLRSEVLNAISENRWALAMTRYMDILMIDAEHVLPRHAQLDIANHLLLDGKHKLAAQAYVKYSTRYPKGENVERAELAAGLIFARYLQQDADAETWVRRAQPKLVGETDRQLAAQLLDELQARREALSESATANRPG